MRNLFLIIVCVCTQTYGQKQGNIWCFGHQSGLNFNSGSPVLFTGSKTGSDLISSEVQEGTASISDSTGALLLYSSGRTIWNFNHQVMTNGQGMFGGPSSTQASIIVPHPGSDSIFYVFTSDEFQGYTNPLKPNKGYRITWLDMCNNSGTGGLYAKNTLLTDSSTEKLAACRDGAGTGYWVVGHKMFSNKFYSWHLTSGIVGVTSTVVSSAGSVHGFYPQNNSFSASAAQGQMKINPAGTRLALVIGNMQPVTIELFDFNSTTGAVSNPCRILLDSALQKSAYGVEFSPDGSKLYVSATGGSGPNQKLYQLDLSAGGGACSAVRSSSVVIYQSTTNGLLFGMQVGPDKKIYVACKAANNIARINFPNLSGSLCNFDSTAITSNNLFTLYTFPSFVAGYNYHNQTISCCNNLSLTVNSSSNIICPGMTVTLTVTGASNYTWTGIGTNSFIVASPTTSTTYTLQGSNSTCKGAGLYTQSVVACTGLNENYTNLITTIYPNPAATSLNVSLAAGVNTNILLRFFSVDGKIVYENTYAAIINQSIEVNIERLPKGLYFIELYNEGRLYHQRFMKE